MSANEDESGFAPVADLEVPFSVVIAETGMPLERILDLRPGVILELPRRHDQTLEARVSGSKIGKGRAVDIGERLGFQLDSVDSAPRNVPGDSSP